MSGATRYSWIDPVKSMSMTPRQRMLAAYQGLAADVIPVAPEFWYYLPARLLGVPMFTLELEIPHWQALQQTFRHYQCEGWGIVTPNSPRQNPQRAEMAGAGPPGRNHSPGPITLAPHPGSHPTLLAG